MRKIAKMTLLNPCMKFKIFFGQKTSFGALQKISITCSRGLKKDSQDFKNSFYLGFLWILSKPGKQNQKVPFFWVFIIVKKKTVCNYCSISSNYHFGFFSFLFQLFSCFLADWCLSMRGRYRIISIFQTMVILMKRTFYIFHYILWWSKACQILSIGYSKTCFMWMMGCPLLQIQP